MRDPTFDPRIGGQVTRYHTWPRIREQSTGEHTWQVLRILLTVWPDCPRKILHYVVFHDVGEMAGDIPYPFKLRVPELGVGMGKAEAMVLNEMRNGWGIAGIPTLGTYEHAAFKCCESIEMWEYGLQEQALGNQYAALISKRMLLQASQWMEAMQKARGDNPDIRPAIGRYIQRRVDDERTQHESPELLANSR